MGIRMNYRLFQEYQFKCYLNGGHFIIIDGNQGQVHPHTWEFIMTILIQKEEFLEFNVFEKAIEVFFAKYQNQTLNKIKPFDEIMPTLENMVDYFGAELRKIIQATDGILIKIEGSETPTRSYIVSYENTAEYMENVDRYTNDVVSKMFDRIIDDVN
jgi:6-pyruvoyltetrahydropterin/6-carboxytetrahydropterin synthase